MEWAVLVGLALVAAALVGLPRGAGVTPHAAAEAEDALREEYRRLLDELAEIDDDAEAGRISAEDRATARRVIAPRLRAATEALQVRGIDPRDADREASR